MGSVGEFSDRFYWKRPLAFQFWVAWTIVVAIAGGSVLFLFLEIRSNVDHSKWLDQVYRTSSQLKFLIRDYYRERIDFLNYMRTGSARDLALFQEDQKLFYNTFDSILSADKNFSGVQPYVENVKRLHSEWLQVTHRMILEKYRGTLRFDREEGLNKKIRQSIDETIGYLDDVLSKRGTFENRRYKRSYIILGASNLIFLFVVGFILMRLYGSIAKPVQLLTSAIRNYRAGDFDTRVAVGSNNQIGYLQASFNELAESISNMVQSLKRLDTMKSDFLNTVSHELRTPLTSIGGYIKLILEGDAGTVNDTQREFLAIADKNVARLSFLINDLLDVEKIESAGGIQLMKEEIELQPLLKEAAETVRPMVESKGLKLELILPEKGVWILGDRSRIFQVVMNLLSNAVKYTETGKIVTEVRSSYPNAVFSVLDTGVGIAQEDQGKLFQKFFRSSAAVRAKVGGTGLGLVIAKGLVEEHGGSLVVESKLGKGSKFTVYIPLLHNTIQLDAEDERIKNVAVGKNVLLVSANADLAFLIKTELTQKGLTVASQTNADFFGKTPAPPSGTHLVIIEYAKLDKKLCQFVEGFRVAAKSAQPGIVIVYNEGEDRWVEDLQKIENVQLVEESKEIDKIVNAIYERFYS